MEKNYEGGVWRTIKGRRVFIRDGEDLGSAMKRSGKFEKTVAKEEYEHNKMMLKEMERRLSHKNLTEEQIDRYENRARQYESAVNEYESRKDGYFLKQMREPEFLKDATKEQRENYYRNIAEKEKMRKMGTSEYLMEKQRNKGNYNDEKPNNLQSKANQVVKGMKENKLKKLSFREQMAKADTWDDIHKSVDSIDNNYIKENLKRSAQKLEEAENGPWKSASYLDKEYIFYENEYERNKYGEYYKKEKLGAPSNYQKGDKIEFDNGYYETIKGSVVREATEKEKKYNINPNLKGYIVRDTNGNEHIVADTRIKKHKNNDISPMSEYSDTTGTGLSDKQHTTLSKMSISKMQSMAREYGIETSGLSKKQLMAKLIAIFNK